MSKVKATLEETIQSAETLLSTDYEGDNFETGLYLSNALSKVVDAYRELNPLPALPTEPVLA